MRAWEYPDYGPPETLVVVERPRPEPGANELLMRVHSTSINPVDWKIANGSIKWVRSAERPLVPGFDVAGEVVALGPGVTGFEVGQRVHARLNTRSGGACAELAVAGLDVVAAMPEGLSFEHAAAMPLAGLTALQALRDDCGMALEGYTGRVLVVGASGGVGHYAVQLAKAAGAEVIGVCSGRNVELVRSLGADDVIDYTQEPDVARRAPYDIVLDCVGADSYFHFRPHIRPGGAFASCIPQKPGTLLGAALGPLVMGPRCRVVMLKTNAPDLQLLDALFTAGRLRSVVEQVFEFDQLPEAHLASMTGRSRGKVVVHMDPR